MISVIVCSRLAKSHTESLHQKMIKATIGVNYEYICIDNSTNTYSICSAYNAGVAVSNGDVCVFMHDDVFCLEEGFGKIVENKFFKNQNIGCIGIAGSNYLLASSASWVSAGRPFIAGAVLHETNHKQILTIYSEEKNDAQVVAVDGLFFAIRKSLFNRIRFDDVTFDGFHGYDMDICMQIIKTHNIVVTRDILMKHKSGGTYSAEFDKYEKRFLAKYASSLPAYCTPEVPDMSRRIGFESYDITDKLPTTMPW